MSPRINAKCLKCSELTVEEAISLHGKEGDVCWDISRCHKRRSHYRNRSDRNSKRQVAYQLSKSVLPEIELSVSQVAAVVLILYKKEFTKDAPVHAIAAELWVGTQKVAHMQPISCLGMRGDQVTGLMPKILRTFSEQFSEQYNQGKPFPRFATKVERNISRCPISTPFSQI